MHKAILLTTGAGVLLAATASSQVYGDPTQAPAVIDQPNCGQPNQVPCGPHPYTPFNNLVFGNSVTEIGQIFCVPNLNDPSGASFYMTATVKRTGRTDWIPASGIWTPGQTPSEFVENTDVAGADGPDDEFQISISRDMKAIVTDTGPSHPIGQGSALLMTRAGTTGAFQNSIVINGIPGGYIDPQLARRSGQDVILWAAPDNSISIGDIDLDPNSANYGNVTNVGFAVRPVTNAGFNFFHSPTPQVDETTGNANAIVCSAFDATNSGSDMMFQSDLDLRPYAASGVSSSEPSPFLTHNDGSDWNANPMCLHGTAIFADAAAAYGDPLRIDFFSCSSATMSVGGGAAEFVAHIPEPAAINTPQSPVIVAFNLGSLFPSGIPISSIPGIAGFGNVWVSPDVVIGQLSTMGNQAKVVLTLGAFSAPVGAVAPVQAVGLNASTGAVWASNVAQLTLVQ